MGLLDGLLGGLVDKEAIITETLKATFEKLHKELEGNANEMFIMIKPCKEDYSFKFYVYKSNKLIREIELSEIIEE